MRDFRYEVVLEYGYQELSFGFHDWAKAETFAQTALDNFIPDEVGKQFNVAIRLHQVQPPHDTDFEE